MGRNRVESVVHRRFQVVYRVGPSSGIESVAVCKENLRSQFLQYIYEGGCIVVSDICDIARFAEVYLYGRELVFEIYLSDSSLSDQFLHLLRKAVAWRCPQVGEIYR